MVSGLIPAYTGLERRGPSGFAMKFWRALRKDDLDLAMSEMNMIAVMATMNTVSESTASIANAPDSLSAPLRTMSLTPFFVRIR